MFALQCVLHKAFFVFSASLRLCLFCRHRQRPQQLMLMHWFMSCVCNFYHFAVCSCLLPVASFSFYVLFSVQQRKWIEWKTIFFSCAKKNRTKRAAWIRKKGMPRLLSNNWFKQHFEKKSAEIHSVPRRWSTRTSTDRGIAKPKWPNPVEGMCIHLLHGMAWMWRCLGCACLKLAFLPNSAVRSTPYTKHSLRCRRSL